MDAVQPGSAAEWHMKLFHASLHQHIRLSNLRQLLGSTSGAVCMDLGDAPAALRRELRRAGGTWMSVASDDSAADMLESMLPNEEVVLLDELSIPLEDDCVDLIVLQDILEKQVDDYEFIQECHRVLKPNGILVICVPNYKKLGLVGGFRNLLGLSIESQGFARAGYTQAELYDLIKDGFDISTRQNFSRFFSEFFETLIKFFVSFFAGGANPNQIVDGDEPGEAATNAYRRAHQIYSLMKPFHWLVGKFDLLLFWTKGYHLVVKAHARPWKPRRGVTLRDGRSISDATINTKIGTAAPF